MTDEQRHAITTMRTATYQLMHGKPTAHQRAAIEQAMYEVLLELGARQPDPEDIASADRALQSAVKQAQHPKDIS